MAAQISAYDWAASPLGAAEGWPPGLRGAVDLMLPSRQPMLIWWGAQRIQVYNDAFRDQMGLEFASLALGAAGEVFWREIWPVIGPQVDQAQHEGRASWNEQQCMSLTRHGLQADEWWTYGCSPIPDGDQTGGVLLVCRDVTASHLSRNCLGSRNAVLQREAELLRHVVTAAPGLVALFDGTTRQLSVSNMNFRRLRQSAGESWLDELRPQLDEVFSTGARLLVHVDVTGSTTPIADMVLEPVLGEDGGVRAVVAVGHETGADVVSRAHHELVIDEMHHRIKNVLATVMAVARLSGRSAASVEGFITGFVLRMAALARTHDLLRAGDHAALDIRSIVELELAPFIAEDGRVKIDCEHIAISAPQAASLALIVHELTTNAVKYGALQDASGGLEVSSRLTGHEVDLRWRESVTNLQAAGPEGFGTRLIGRLAKALRGVATLERGQGGLDVRIAFPLR